MSLSINEVVHARIVNPGMTARRRDLNMIALFTHSVGLAFQDASTRYIVVASSDDVANLFGNDSEVYRAAQSIFSANMRPKQVTIARWAREEQKIPATFNELRGSTISLDVNLFREINDGSFGVIIGGTKKEYTELDFSEAYTYEGVAEVINKALTADKLKAFYDTVGARIIISAITAGEDKTTEISYVYAIDEGVYIGNDLRLEDGQATLRKGAKAVTVSKETIAKAMTLLNNVNQNWYGADFAVSLTDGEIDLAHAWIASSMPERVMAYTAIKEDQLEFKNDNILKKLHDKNSGRIMVQYNRTGDDHAGSELLALALSTVWNAVSTAQTLKFKEFNSVQSDDRIKINEATKARKLGINFYTDYDGVAMNAEGTMLGGRFIDEIVGLDAFIDACRVDAFNALKGPPKIPQTDRGQQVLIGALQKTGQEFNTNGFLAPGKWNGPDMGDFIKNGDYLEKGYLFFSESYDVQSQADRDARKAMPIMAAIKLAGAIHTVDILISFNR